MALTIFCSCFVSAGLYHKREVSLQEKYGAWRYVCGGMNRVGYVFASQKLFGALSPRDVSFVYGHCVVGARARGTAESPQRWGVDEALEEVFCSCVSWMCRLGHSIDILFHKAGVGSKFEGYVSQALPCAHGGGGLPGPALSEHARLGGEYSMVGGGLRLQKWWRDRLPGEIQFVDEYWPVIEAMCNLLFHFEIGGQSTVRPLAISSLEEGKCAAKFWEPGVCPAP